MKSKRIILTVTVIAIVFCTFFTVTACNKDKGGYESLLNPDAPVSIEIWNYYSGPQATEFDALVKKFNDTEGRTRGIIVSTTAQSNINNLADELIKAVDGNVGAQEVPDIAAIYPETAYILKQKNAIVPVEDYLSAGEWSQYIPSFLDTGRFSADGKIYGFPISKSTEILAYNKTDWTGFASAKGISIDSIETAEDMVEAARLYYEYTDGLTPSVAEDGKALYGRDSMANYLYIGAARLGKDIAVINADGSASVNIDKATFRTLWDNYYIPYINGYFGGAFTKGSYRSGDMKTGKILACTGSSSSVNYIDATVTDINEQSHAIELVFAKPLSIENGTKEMYVQQGASYYVMKSTDAKQYAASQFLKWFTAKEQNLAFSVNVGYSPVKKDSNTETAITEAMEASGKNNEKVLSTLKISTDIFNNSVTYASPAFEQAKELREYLESSFNSVLSADRAAVLASISGGSTRAAATANFSTDAYFDSWYNALVAGVNGIMA